MKKIVILALFLIVAVGASFVAYRSPGIHDIVGAHHQNYISSFYSIEKYTGGRLKIWAKGNGVLVIKKGDVVVIPGIDAHSEYKYLGSWGRKLIFQEKHFTDIGTHSEVSSVLPYTLEQYYANRGNDKYALHGLIYELSRYNDNSNDVKAISTQLRTILQNEPGSVTELCLSFYEDGQDECFKFMKKLLPSQDITVEKKNKLLFEKNYEPQDIRYLVENGANINYENEKGETVLFPIVLQNTRPSTHGVDENRCREQIERLQTLIELGIDIGHKDKLGKTVIDYIGDEIRDCDNNVKDKWNQRKECTCLFVSEEILKGNNPITADEEECSSMPDFDSVIYLRKKYCTPRCLNGQFRINTGSCLDCDYSGNTRQIASSEECAKCPNRRSEGNDECILTTCPKNMIKHTDMYGMESCLPCSISLAIKTTKDECDKCLNREYKGNLGECTLK